MDFSKLGIKEVKNIPCSHLKPSEMVDYVAIKDVERKSREAEYREMLEALIDIVSTHMTYVEDGEIEQEAIQRELNIIEKATGKSWNEVEKLINS